MAHKYDGLAQFLVSSKLTVALLACSLGSPVCMRVCAGVCLACAFGFWPEFWNR